jgi:eukaryotic-like serine/threonine-protein kinase
MEIAPDEILAGRYRVECALGHGGMGAVWRAVDLRLNRRVAVKLAAASPNSRATAGQARRRLRREAAALAALSEPRIARVYDLVEVDDDVCLVMELVDGESLAARLRREPRLAADEALEIAAQCAQALEAAHRIGIVHRDVKPSNIMLGPDGVKVVDFGIAAHIGPASGDTTATMTHGVVGTAAYLAPERALGQPAAGAADFYSLGVVLYQMLAGHLPFLADDSLAMLYAHTRSAPEPLPGDVPAPAAALCLRMLNKKPEQRPTSTREITAAREALTATRSTDLLAASAAAAAWLRAKPLSATRRPLAHRDRARREALRHGTARPDGRPARRGPTTLLAAASSTAALLAATSAWFLLDQSASAGAATTPSSAPTSTSTSAPAVVVQPSQTGHSAVTHTGPQPTTPVSLVKPKTSAPTTHSAAVKDPVHSGPDKHGKHGGGGGKVEDASHR